MGAVLYPLHPHFHLLFLLLLLVNSGFFVRSRPHLMPLFHFGRIAQTFRRCSHSRPPESLLEMER